MAHECSECSFADSMETVFVFNIPRELKEKFSQVRINLASIARTILTIDIWILLILGFLYWGNPGLILKLAVAVVILIFVRSRLRPYSSSFKIEFCGMYTFPGWSGHTGVYLFRCDDCGEVRVDSPHGYTESGLFFLRCSKCKKTFPLEPRDSREIYVRENAHIPKETLKERQKELNDIVEALSKKGVRVVVKGLGEV